MWKKNDMVLLQMLVGLMMFFLSLCVERPVSATLRNSSQLLDPLPECHVVEVEVVFPRLCQSIIYQESGCYLQSLGLGFNLISAFGLDLLPLN